MYVFYLTLKLHIILYLLYFILVYGVIRHYCMYIWWWPPVGDSLLANTIYKSGEVLIEGHCLGANLVELNMIDFDVILSMDWLTSSHATLDCYNKVVKLYIPGEQPFMFSRDPNLSTCNLITTKDLIGCCGKVVFHT